MHGDPDRWEARRQKRRLMICGDEGESKYVTGQPHYTDLPLSLHLKSRIRLCRATSIRHLVPHKSGPYCH